MAGIHLILLLILLPGYQNCGGENPEDKSEFACLRWKLVLKDCCIPDKGLLISLVSDDFFY